ncbi:hypothetical protein [Altericista sp. CCNU0014]
MGEATSIDRPTGCSEMPVLSGKRKKNLRAEILAKPVGESQQ